MSEPIMKRLREETAVDHRQLEDRLDISRWFETKDQYRRLMEMFYGFITPMETALASHAWSDSGLEFGPRRKKHLLNLDLVQLDVSAEALPICSELPNLSTFARAWGALYVLEGSTLGGQQIRKIAQQHGTPDSQLHYFTAYGEDTRRRWMEFGEKLEQYAQTSGKADEIVDGARDTFRAFHHWVCETLPVSRG